MATADETREALVEAMIGLLAERGPAAIPVREVAAAAGVNHGLVHRYFGSKDGLVRAAVQRITAEIHAGTPDRPGMSAWTFAYLRARPELARMVARACLEGPDDVLAAAAPDPERLDAIVGPIGRALGRAGLGGQVDPHVVNALASAALLGWFAFRPLLREGFGLPDDADDQLEAALAQLDVLLQFAGQ